MGYPRSPLSAECGLEEEKEDRQGGRAGRAGPRLLHRHSVIVCLSLLQWGEVAICSTSVLPESIRA